MHEIVTVQLGDFANFTGSHYWNLLVGAEDAALSCRCYLTHADRIILLLRMKVMDMALHTAPSRKQYTVMSFIRRAPHSRFTMLQTSAMLLSAATLIVSAIQMPLG